MTYDVITKYMSREDLTNPSLQLKLGEQLRIWAAVSKVRENNDTCTK